ncbi:Protein of uncharacterised function (DUF1479) [Cedecea neteri]|uniref:Protein of uncharacterized function (DUF1479) n=1 Tax=Cedecea neteri TaxID=158822 RepID=A0A2X3IXI9_9ENTR|nr:Protein of uncharacterised function (DUF1479) [Cedecea neteri]
MHLDINDLPKAIREIKQKLRHDLPNYQSVFAELEANIRQQIETIRAEMDRGENPVPQLNADDILHGHVSEQQKTLIRQRGCCTVRGRFPAGTGHRME